MNKIDPNIFSKIKTLASNDNMECIVYAHNYRIAKKYISNLVDKNYIIDFPFIKISPSSPYFETSEISLQ